MQPEELVAASLKGLELGEVVCMPALADSRLLDQIEADEKDLFEKSRTGVVANRYKV